jgi:hypothetical protein
VDPDAVAIPDMLSLAIVEPAIVDPVIGELSMAASAFV